LCGSLIEDPGVFGGHYACFDADSIRSCVLKA
jgi:hypothetical protein